MKNPFEDADDSVAFKKNYLMFISVQKDNAKATQKAVDNLKETVDKNAWPLWVDSKGIGIFIETDLVAGDIRHAAFKGVAGDFADIKDALVVEVGKDWYASDGSPMKNWLMAHVGAPLAQPLDSRLRPRRGGAR